MEAKPLPSAVAAKEYVRQMLAVAARLAPFELTLAEGTPTSLRRPAVIQREPAQGPVVLLRVELDGAVDADGQPVIPAAIDTLASALASTDASAGIDLRVLCTPSGSETGSASIARNLRSADLELKLDISSDDIAPGEEARRRLHVEVTPKPGRTRFALWLESHPFLYSLAVLAEFSFKHPLFGQILCGGPCGISGAWQFTCTMGKTFFSKRQIEENFLRRPVFEAIRNDPRSYVRAIWRGWEAGLRGALWPVIWLRKLITAVAARLPRAWFTEAKGVARTMATLFVNHLECPKSIRNGACGAPTDQGLCGELQKYGISKPCVFYYRNSRDLAGIRLAARLEARAQGLGGRAWPLPWVAALLQTIAAIVDRRQLSTRVYERVNLDVPGASAIVNAMAGRFKGLTMVGAPGYLPPHFTRSEIKLLGRSARGEALLIRARARLRNLPHTVNARAAALATILKVLEDQSRGWHTASGQEAFAGSTYERVLVHQSHDHSHQLSGAAH